MWYTAKRLWAVVAYIAAFSNIAIGMGESRLPYAHAINSLYPPIHPVNAFISAWSNAEAEAHP